ncbi:MAG TPA: autotransporter domain-containing protein [Rhodanobacteraceae bacterium]|nr:autotransporter domain-containing protein [Rhodanobacteraceae bacterium]
MPRIRILAGALALAISGSAAAAQFDNVVVFGDSLSDNGNISLAQQLPFAPSRFTTNPGLLAIEHVADYYGITLTPSLTGGSDFAFGGAGVINNSPGTPSTVPTLPVQLQAYLAATGGKADPNALYSVWGGANDLFYAATSAGAAATAQQLIQQNIQAQVQQAIANNVIPNDPTAIAAFTAQITPIVTQQVTAQVEAAAGVSTLMNAAQAQASLQQAAQAELQMIGQLGQAGAKRVIVFNLPDVGQAPSSLAQGPTAAAQITGLSIVYNTTLNAGLAQAGVDIIPIDTFGLIHEVIANPSLYGFSNVTDAACGLTSSSLACGPAGSDLPYTYASGTDQTYLFADGVHPTTAAHALLGQYVVSVIQAPGQQSLLAEAPLAVTDSVNRSLRNQALSGMNQPSQGVRWFANYDYNQQKLDATANTPKSDNNQNTLTVGADVHPDEHISVGMALSGANHRDGFADDAGGFKLDEYLVSAYAMYGWQQGYFGAIGNVGQLNYHDIDRNIALGPALRRESGSTSGSHVALMLTGGWLFGSDALRTGPYADIGYQRIRVSGFAENGGDSTAMTFDRQEREAMIGTLGWQVIGNWQAGGTALHPYAQVAWNHDSKADPRDVRAGLVNMPGTFGMPGFVPDKTWGSAGVGLNAQFSPGFSAWVSYDGRFSDSNERDNSLNVGAKLSF